MHINHYTDSIWQNAIIMLHSNQFIGGIFHIYCWCLVKFLGSTIFFPHTSSVNIMMLICYYCVVHKFHADRLVFVIKLEEIEIQEPGGSKNMKFLLKSNYSIGNNNEQNDTVTINSSITARKRPKGVVLDV